MFQSSLFLFHPHTMRGTNLHIFPGSKNVENKNFGSSKNLEAQNFLNFIAILYKKIKFFFSENGLEK